MGDVAPCGGCPPWAGGRLHVEVMPLLRWQATRTSKEKARGTGGVPYRGEGQGEHATALGSMQGTFRGGSWAADNVALAADNVVLAADNVALAAGGRAPEAGPGGSQGVHVPEAAGGVGGTGVGTGAEAIARGLQL